MSNKCEIVKDLLPLYLDGICSEASKQYVDEHITTCRECKQLLKECRADFVPESIRIPDEADVLKHTAWQINKRAIGCAIGITLIVIYWLIFLWQDALSSQGDYRYFSYSTHEIYTIGYLLVPLVTAIWFAKVFFGAVKRKNWRKNAVLILTLALLLSLQVGYIHRQSQVVHTTNWTEVVNIPDEYHIVIQSGDGYTTLKTTPVVTRLLKTDGTIYGFYYERNKNSSEEGVLNGVWPSQD